MKTSGIFVNQSIKRIKIIEDHSIKLKKYSENVLAMLQSSCCDCSKSLQLTLPTITSDYLVPCGETHLTNSSAKSFIPNPPPSPPYLLSASVMSPFHIFTFTSWKQLAVPILRKLKFLLISQYQPSRC